jgi:hypothetical protein
VILKAWPDGRLLPTTVAVLFRGAGTRAVRCATCAPRVLDALIAATGAPCLPRDAQVAPGQHGREPAPRNTLHAEPAGTLAGLTRPAGARSSPRPYFAFPSTRGPMYDVAATTSSYHFVFSRRVFFAM